MVINYRLYRLNGVMRDDLAAKAADFYGRIGDTNQKKSL